MSHFYVLIEVVIPMTKILVVDDEQAIRTLIRKYALMHNFEVFEASDGVEALDVFETQAIDLVVLDVMMPMMNGYDVLKSIRRSSEVPVIMLTARDGEFDKFQGFELGVDDYVVKPFSPRELFYRIEAILKRGKAIRVDLYHYKGFELNYSARSLKIDGERIDLSSKEYELMVYFIKNKDIALHRDQLIAAVWGYDFEGDERTLDTHIKRLRKKLGAYQDTIVTLRGVGYRYEEVL